MVSLAVVLALTAAMAVKHFCADFLLQTGAIARGKASADHWLRPLCIHAGGHAALTLLVALLFFPSAWWVAPLEFLVHALVDRGKVLFGRWAALEMNDPRYWWLFGFDQLLHHLTNVAIVGVFLGTTA